MLSNHMNHSWFVAFTGWLFDHAFTGGYQIMALGMAVAGLGYTGIHP